MNSNAGRAPFTQRAIRILRSIPAGRVATYGQVAALAGGPGGARQVVRLLHSLSSSECLPWHRIVNAKGAIALAEGAGFEMQKALLEAEGIRVSPDGRIDLNRHLWSPSLEDDPLP
jgi:methylated-DNA-protein-cysteine methyltransferase-like protein